MIDQSASLEQQRTTEILKGRARLLAQLPERAQSPDNSILIVEFRLAQERYAIEQCYVREIWPLEALTPLPCVPAHFVGMINVRGQILPVIDIRTFFDLPACGITDLHMVLVTCVDDMELGILADAVNGVVQYPREDLQESLPTLTGIRGEYLLGITADQVVVLDVCRILRDPRLIVNEEVKS